MRRLIAATASVGAVAFAYYLHPAPPRGGDTELGDLVITYGMPVVLYLAVFVMLLSRDTWNIRAIGVFYVTLASAFLLTVIAMNRNRGKYEPGTLEFVTDLARASYLIGGPALLFGVLTWIWFRIRDKGRQREHEDVTGLPVYDRRKVLRRKRDSDAYAALRQAEERNG